MNCKIIAYLTLIFFLNRSFAEDSCLLYRVNDNLGKDKEDSVNLRYTLPESSLNFEESTRIKLHFNRFKGPCILVKIYLYDFHPSLVNSTINFLASPLLGYKEAVTILVYFPVESSKNDNLIDFALSLQQTSLLYAETEPDNLNASNPTPLIKSTIVFITETEWSVFCPLCSLTWNTSLPVWYSQDFKEIGNARLINRNLQGAALHFFSTTPGEGRASQNEVCYDEQIALKPPDCQTSHVILKLIKNHLNLSRVEMAEYNYSTEAGPHLCIMCGYPQQLLENKKAHFDGLILTTYFHSLQAFYCYPRNQTRKSSLPEMLQSFFVPFDGYTWAGLVIASVASALFHRGVSNGFDVWIAFLEQSLQAKWNSKFLAGAYLICVYVVDTLYQSYVTSSLTAPTPERRISTLLEMYNAGYRFPAGLAQLELISSHIPLSLQREKYGEENNGSFVNVLAQNTGREVFNYSLKQFRLDALAKYFRVMPKPMVLKILRLFGGDKLFAKVTDMTCTYMKHPLWLQAVQWFVRGHGAREVAGLVQRVEETGIQPFWDKMNERMFVFAILKVFREDFEEQGGMEGVGGRDPFGNQGQHEWSPLNFNSGVFAAFLLFFYSIALCFIGFGYEMIMKVQRAR